MKAILVPIEHHDGAVVTLRLAATLAGRFDSLVEGFALQMPPLAGLAWDPASVAILQESEWDHRRTLTEAEALFRSTMTERGLAEVAGGGGGGEASPAGPRWHWNGEPMAGDGFLGTLGRAFDLTVVGQPRQAGPSITSLETALFDSGGPILIAPPRETASFGETIVVAWNGSSETARTIAFAKPLLRRGRRVVVLADDGSIRHHPPGALVQRRLELSGIAAELKLLADGRIRSGEAILEEARAIGCDLLVKGAYTQSRLRQMIFGGATNHILANADMPVFMAH